MNNNSKVSYLMKKINDSIPDDLLLGDLNNFTESIEKKNNDYFKDDISTNNILELIKTKQETDQKLKSLINEVQLAHEKEVKERVEHLVIFFFEKLKENNLPDDLIRVLLYDESFSVILQPRYSFIGDYSLDEYREFESIENEETINELIKSLVDNVDLSDVKVKTVKTINKNHKKSIELINNFFKATNKIKISFAYFDLSIDKGNINISLGEDTDLMQKMEKIDPDLCFRKNIKEEVRITEYIDHISEYILEF